LTALQLRIVSNTGGYGTHGGSVLFHCTGESAAVYRCPNKKIDAYAVYTNKVPARAFPGYRLSPTLFAVESALDPLARARRNGSGRVPAPQRHPSRGCDDLAGRRGARPGVRQLRTGSVSRWSARRPRARQRGDPT